LHDTSRRLGTSFAPRLLYFREKSTRANWILGSVSHRFCLTCQKKERSLSSDGDRSTISQLSSRLLSPYTNRGILTLLCACEMYIMFFTIFYTWNISIILHNMNTFLSVTNTTSSVQTLCIVGQWYFCELLSSQSSKWNSTDFVYVTPHSLM